MNCFKALSGTFIRPIMLLCAVVVVCLPQGGGEAAPGPELSLKMLQSQQAGEMAEPILAAFQNGAADKPGAELMLIKAWALQSTGRYEEALAVYEEIIAADPTLLSARYGKAVCLFELQRTADSSLEVGEIAKKWPKSLEYLALRNMSRGKIKAGEKSAWETEIEQYRPRTKAEAFFKAEWLFANERLGDALRIYDTLQEDNPDSLVPFLREAEILVNQKKYRKAIDKIDKIIAKDDNCGAAWRIKGEALAGLNRDEEALACYTKSDELGVDNAKLYGKRGDLFAKQRNYREALAEYSLAVARAPSDYKLFYARYRAYRSLGEQRKAYADLCKAADLSDDKLAELHYLRGMMARGLGFRQDAIKSLEKYLHLAADDDHNRAYAVAVLAALSY